MPPTYPKLHKSFETTNMAEKEIEISSTRKLKNVILIRRY